MDTLLVWKYFQLWVGTSGIPDRENWISEVLLTGFTVVGNLLPTWKLVERHSRWERLKKSKRFQILSSLQTLETKFSPTIWLSLSVWVCVCVAISNITSVDFQSQIKTSKVCGHFIGQLKIFPVMGWKFKDTWSGKLVQWSFVDWLYYGSEFTAYVEACWVALVPDSYFLSNLQTLRTKVSPTIWLS